MAEEIKPPIDVEYDDDGKPIVPPADIKVESVVPPLNEGAGKEPEDEDIENPDIPVRASASFIIARQKDKIEKLRSKLGDESDNAQAEEQDDLTPEAQSAVEKAVQRQLTPVIDTLFSKAEDEELEAFLLSTPDAGKYSKRIKAYMKHPGWKQVPVKAIYHHLSHESIVKKAGENKQIADEESAHNTGAGTARHPLEPTEDGNVPSVEEQNDMSDAEFEKLQNRVLAGEFKPKDEE